jgi:hypothetical protein
MKETTNIQRSIQYLYKIFNELNEHYFDSELEKPIITIQSTPTAYGHFTPWNAYRIKKDDGTTVGNVEINIGAGTLDRPIENVVSTLEHELIHYYCYKHGIKDTSRNGQYHNKKFRDEAEKRGLIISYDSRIGWSATEPSEELIDFIISCGFEDFRIGRNEVTSYRITGTGAHSTNGTATTKKGNSHKLICPCCGTIVRFTTKRAPHLFCMDCNKPMIEA